MQVGAQIVRLQHKEAEGYLGCERLGEPRTPTGGGSRARSGSIPEDMEAYVSRHDAASAHSSNAIWQVVKEELLDGSPCAWGGRVRLKHLGSDHRCWDHS